MNKNIDWRIISVRGYRVMLDADLAELYGVTTKRLNEQVKRNKDRFPNDFMLQLTPTEKAEVVANCDHLQRLKFSPALPYAFTEHGAVMLASVIDSKIAINASIQIVRAFIHFRSILGSYQEMARRMDRLEEEFAAIKSLLESPLEPSEPEDDKGPMGF
ncbi:MAG TPA: ORF6N domain-containing protein [Candidatus Paceibacterota bacterium]|nr:ORF6N domain-containing protein [Candidatus Paceibacterota bacterium]